MVLAVGLVCLLSDKHFLSMNQFVPEMISNCAALVSLV